MSTRPLVGTAVSLCLATILWTAPPASAQAEDAVQPLDRFGALAVGTWEDASSQHVLEWGVGRLLIRSRSYALAGEDPRLVSEGIWYWDDEAGAIRGVVLATGMPVERFEYLSRVRGHEIVHQLEAHGDMTGSFIETWSFDGDGDVYRWRLERPGADGPVQLMGGVYRKASTRSP
jgi:hypothetical protein